MGRYPKGVGIRAAEGGGSYPVLATSGQYTSYWNAFLLLMYFV